MHRSSHCQAQWYVIMLAGLTIGCGQGQMMGPAPDGGGMNPGTQPDAGVIPCGETGRVITFFEERCSGCHSAGGQFPDLTRTGLASLASLQSQAHPAEPLLVSGDPEGSWLYHKMTGEQNEPGDVPMPLGIGSGRPVEELPMIADWIRNGAPTECDELDDSRVAYDPNTLNQDELFTCADPSAPRSSPARLRRVERDEWTHGAMRNTSGTWWGSIANQNPLVTPPGTPYSSYAADLTIDATTLDLLTLYLEEAAITWSSLSDPDGNYNPIPPPVRRQAIYGDSSFRCIFGDGASAPDCRARFVDTLLRRGILFRAPREDERARLRALLNERLDAESGDAERWETLIPVVKAAYLMTGGLFRSEVGEVVDGSRRLSADELALTLGRILDTHPVAVSHSDRPLPASHPDADNAELGYMSAIRQAADDGSIFEPETRRAILRRYGGGQAERLPSSSAREAGALLPDRHDLEGSPGESRGEYWLAPNFRRFFREWLDYDSAITSFKDTPTATSAYEGNRGAARGFNNLQGQYYGSESNLVEQLDDTVARAVVHSHDRSEDVFRHLLTTREWRLPASDRETAPVACETSADCADNPALIFDSCDSEGYCINGLGERTAGETRCYRPEEPRCPRYLSCAPNGFCGSSVSGNTSGATFVYGVDDPVNAYPDRRWQTMTSQRIGVLTHPAWLAAHGGNFEDDASLVLRGKWIREQLFCETVPPLDLVMVEAQLVPSREDLNARDRMEESFDESEDGDTCRSCHEEMNSLGLPFETFNHAGFERASDHGSAPDASTVITNLPDSSLNRNYSTTQEFIEALAGSAYARRGFVRHAFRYFMGRPEVLADGCTLAEMEAALDETGSFFAMMEALVVSQTLTHRHIAEGESR